MKHADFDPVASLDNLKDRIERLLCKPVVRRAPAQLSLDMEPSQSGHQDSGYAKKSISDFLDFLVALVPNGDVYLFGGVLRDVALYGKRGFHSDIDLVIVGDWGSVAKHLEYRGASRNRFGGYRLQVNGWPIDLWSAEKTWAIAEGHVPYHGVASLLETTILNWDAILMNWRTRRIICHEDYLEKLSKRILDIVLKPNPNPLGMAVRVFRHLSITDPSAISHKAVEYLTQVTRRYSYLQLVESEVRSYGNQVIDQAVYHFFAKLALYEGMSFQESWDIAERSLLGEGIRLANLQQSLPLSAPRQAPPFQN